MNLILGIRPSSAVKFAGVCALVSAVVAAALVVRLHKENAQHSPRDVLTLDAPTEKSEATSAPSEGAPGSGHTHRGYTISAEFSPLGGAKVHYVEDATPCTAGALPERGIESDFEVMSSSKREWRVCLPVGLPGSLTTPVWHGLGAQSGDDLVGQLLAFPYEREGKTGIYFFSVAGACQGVHGACEAHFQIGAAAQAKTVSFTVNRAPGQHEFYVQQLPSWSIPRRTPDLTALDSGDSQVESATIDQAGTYEEVDLEEAP